MKKLRLTTTELEQLGKGPIDPHFLNQAGMSRSDPIELINDETGKLVGHLRVMVEYVPLESDVTTTTGKITEVKLYTDGGSRGNPGPAASGWVVYDLNDKQLLEGGHFLGIDTNNKAEYTALKMGLLDAKKIGAHRVQVFMDSELIVKQMTGIYKIKNADLRPIYDHIQDQIQGFKSVTFTHVPRALNKEADRMVNRTLDRELGQ